MKRMSLSLVLLLVFLWGTALAQSTAYKEKIFDPGPLKSIDSRVKVTAGQIAPDFTLPAIDGRTIRLSDYRGEKNVVLSFVPAAWTPVCSDQWPGYHLARGLFEDHDAVVLGISTDNTPSQFAWVRQMEGLWFPVLSDFWPHGAVADQYGLLRGDGMTERALVFIDKKGIITYVHVNDINTRPKLDLIAAQLAAMNK
ncbi:peroxiredoxin [Desulfatitalea tepidiphila]|uniref:peroxiredoxin n=1 Tax=Desulfatitalea tepidiphila TaxID=1185843 RepID=UPI0006B68C06|nr:peroxiredoxin [Desulfatitalea tepidiphila]